MLDVLVRRGLVQNSGYMQVTLLWFQRSGWRRQLDGTLSWYSRDVGAILVSRGVYSWYSYCTVNDMGKL